MSTNDPDPIRSEIEQTRGELSRNVDALGDAMAPGNIAKRQAEKVAGVAVGIKDKVMGSAADYGETAGGAASDAASSVSGAAGDLRHSAVRRTRGNPIAAGLVALGAGWLIGSMLPSSERERQLASTVKDKAEPVMEEAKAVAGETADHLKEPAMQAAQSVKETTTNAAQTVTSEAQRAGEDVRESAEASKDSVKEHQARPTTSL